MFSVFLAPITAVGAFFIASRFLLDKHLFRWYNLFTAGVPEQYQRRERKRVIKARLTGLAMAVLVGAGVFGWVYLPNISGGLLTVNPPYETPEPTLAVTPKPWSPTPQP
jgi:hypothetical protein